MFRLDEAAVALGWHRSGPDVVVRGVTTDSRSIEPGDLFVALAGERFDGHDFVDRALAAGAAAALVSATVRVKTAGAALLLTGDTRVALGALASWWRARFDLPLVGITGSNGKTTVKDMLAGILRAEAGAEAVLATAGNLNNDIGLPLMLLRLRARHRFAVIEMGMNHLGEIAYLARLARPAVAAINNAGTAHVGELGSRDNIARAKGEIFEGLRVEGVKVINADDRYGALWRSLAPGHRIVDFALDAPAAVTGTFELTDGGSLVTIATPDGAAVARLRVPGIHNVRNALCAAAAAHALGIAPVTIAAGLSAFEGTKGRLQRKAGPGGSVIIDDTYNANPDSMQAAITWLAGLPGKRIFVMGDMGELGAESDVRHVEIGEFARDHGLDALFALGEASAGAARAFGEGARHFEDPDALVAAIEPECDAATKVLVKGSRFMRMERIVARLAPDAATAGEH
jgi:UDP-N-acetylmuramoyl-tripeptide--D-alanyl-D-alanine ligase